MKEKNLDYLLRLEKSIKNIKINKNLESKDNIKSVNITPKRKINIFKQKLKYFESPKKQCNNKDYKISISQNIKNINKENNKISFGNTQSNFKDINNYKALIEEDEEFKELNEYEKKRILSIVKEEENVRNYRKYIYKILNDNKFFEVINSDDRNKDYKNKNNNNINSLDKKTKKIYAHSRNNDKMKYKINIDSLDDISFSSNKPEIPNNKNIDVNLKKYKNNFGNKINLKMINNKYKYSRNIKIPRLRKSLTLKNVLCTKKNNVQVQLFNSIQNINKNKKEINNKRLSYSVNNIFNCIKKNK